MQTAEMFQFVDMKPVEPSRVAPASGTAGRHCSSACHYWAHSGALWPADPHCSARPSYQHTTSVKTSCICKGGCNWAKLGSHLQSGQVLSLEHCSGSHLQSCLSMPEVGSCCHHKVVLQGRRLPEQLQEG